MIQEINAKTILTRYPKADDWFHIKYAMNLYRGCQHQCIYCDSRSECYRIENFLDVLVKVNAIELLKKEILSLREKNTIGTGSMNDPYMPLEKEYMMTRQALQVIADTKFPVHVITKSNLVTRDIDILSDISDTFATVSVTVTTTDNRLASIIEPGAPSPKERLLAVKKLREAGIHAGITLMPVLPYITDSSDNIKKIFELACANGAEYILAAPGVTLRDRQRDYFFNRLSEQLPEVLAKYKKNYHGTYGFDSPYAKNINELLNDLGNKYNIKLSVPAYTPPDEKQLKLF